MNGLGCIRADALDAPASARKNARPGEWGTRGVRHVSFTGRHEW